MEDRTYIDGFWDNREEAQKILQNITYLKDRLQDFQKLPRELEDVQALWDLATEAEDESMAGEIAALLGSFQRHIEKLELEMLLSGAYDNHGAILSLHAGTGGTEAQDWCEMLLRMYLRYCEDMGFKVEMLDTLAGEEAGIKSVTFAANGTNAYGYLKSEKGVHRLVRMSPFDASGRRHTSFASVDVIPQVENDSEIEIDPDDLKMDTYRSGGKGGQHVNKTDSAVRITHLPTGIVVQCQEERSQHSNRDKAMRMLRAKLLEQKLEAQEAEMAEIRGEQKEIGWGSQIRSYIFQPYRLVKDHRTNVENGNVDAVMDGCLEPFVSAYLHKYRKRD